VVINPIYLVVEGDDSGTQATFLIESSGTLAGVMENAAINGFLGLASAWFEGQRRVGTVGYPAPPWQF
jgi:hypothetical protein